MKSETGKRTEEVLVLLPYKPNRTGGCWLLHCLCLLLGENSDAEISILMWLKGGWDDQVFSRRQLEAGGHLPQVDEGL